jgi:lysophospholipase L1-like esterase
MTLALLLFGAISMLDSPPNTNRLINPGFEEKLKGWKTLGDVKLSTVAALQGTASLRLGSGGGSATQRYNVPGERVLYLAATFRGQSLPLKCKLAVDCVDRAGKVLMVLASGAESGKPAAIYFKTHPFTDHISVRLENASGSDVVVDDVQLIDEARGVQRHRPEVDLETSLIPFWEGSTIRNESVLLLKKGSREAMGKLLFAPTEVMSVTDSSGRLRFKQGLDFSVSDRDLVAQPGSAIPTMRSDEFATGKYPWTRFDGRHIQVTYRHQGAWDGPRPVPQGALLPRTNEKLKAGKRLTIVAFGDSITLGVNVSGIRNAPPYLPAWPTLVARSLGKVKLYNVALGGMNSQWAKDSARDLVGTTNPDLVLIAFGMNDFWSLTPAQFGENIRAAMANIREKQPFCEFVLISPMKFLPEYADESPYAENLAGYAEELKAMSGPGVAFFDMTSMSQALYNAKGAPGLLADPLHPADFLARVHAQGVVATIHPK